MWLLTAHFPSVCILIDSFLSSVAFVICMCIPLYSLQKDSFIAYLYNDEVHSYDEVRMLCNPLVGHPHEHVTLFIGDIYSHA